MHRRLRLMLWSLSVPLAVVNASLAMAQTVTPSGDLGPPTAAECQIAPRSEAEIMALAATPVASAATPEAPEPATLPEGDPADPAVIAALEQTLREVVACAEARDLGRLLALYTDEYIRSEVFADEPVPIVPGSSGAGTPEPGSSPVGVDRTPVILEARMLPDGRAAALVTIVEPGAPVDVVWFAEVSDRWLIDAVRPAATPAATPVETTEPSPVSDELLNSPPVQAVLADAASRLGTAPDQVTIVTIEPVEWPDTSLGCPQPGEFYAQVITPGYRIIIESEGQRLEYHTDMESNFVLCEAPA